MKASPRFAILLSLAIGALIGAGPSFGAPKQKQTQNPAIVFMVAGQSNAGGYGVYSPEMHKELGRDKDRPLVPGTTASEVGLPTDAASYTHSYIWMPKTGFERLDPMVNTRPGEPGQKMHGIELPMAHRLEERFPDNDIYIIKSGPSGRSLDHDWHASSPFYSKWLDSCRQALWRLDHEYPEVRVIGLYWDQGEANTVEHPGSTSSIKKKYRWDLSQFIARFRSECGLPQLKVFICKNIYRDEKVDEIIAAQEEFAAGNKNCFLLDIELESREKNFETWSYSPNSIHLNSKAFVELARILMEDVLKNPGLGSFDLCKLLPVHDETGGWAFTLENPEDEVVLAMHGKNLEVKIKCPRGKGRGKLSRLAGVEELPEQIVFLIRKDDGKPLERLEGFEIRGKQLTINASGRDFDITGKQLKTCGNGGCVMGNNVEKTEDAMKITIPGIILAGESVVNVQWIDYYTR